MQPSNERRTFMKSGYRAQLLMACMSGMALPAFAQPASLLTPLTPQPDKMAYSSNQPFLAAAHDDVEKHRWHTAEAGLERSETFLLNNGVRSSNGMVTSPSPAMSYIIQARMAVQQRDQVDALLEIDKAMSTMATPADLSAVSAIPQNTAPPSPPATATTPAPAASPIPMVTKALLPGRWQLTGWQYHWVPPDTAYRTVQTNPYIPGHYAYRSGAWVWVAGHYANASS
jgi:hypothetical protein